jgi:hypothetical protein
MANKYYTPEEIDAQFGLTGIGKMVHENLYKNWLKLRNDTKNDEGKLCYCGHTNRCDCVNPDFECFELAIQNGNIIPGDPNNGWKSYPDNYYERK